MTAPEDPFESTTAQPPTQPAAALPSKLMDCASNNAERECSASASSSNGYASSSNGRMSGHRMRPRAFEQFDVEQAAGSSSWHAAIAAGVQARRRRMLMRTAALSVACIALITLVWTFFGEYMNMMLVRGAASQQQIWSPSAPMPPVQPPPAPSMPPHPLMPPAQPSPAAPWTVDILNERFALGGPSSEQSSLASKGVIVHVLDYVEGGIRDGMEPWRVVGADGRPTDRISASLINARAPYIFYDRDANGDTLLSTGIAGFVYKPDVADGKVLCMWANDAGTIGMPSCDGCVPGCTAPWMMDGWCRDLGSASYCPWRPSQLDKALRQQLAGIAASERQSSVENSLYNEVVFDGPSCEAAMPRLIEAIFATPERIDLARSLQSSVAAHFKGTHVPVVALGVAETGLGVGKAARIAAHEPFSVAE